MIFGFRPGLGVTRLMMVIGSFWPLFLLWAIRGSNLLDDYLLIIICAVLIIIPNLFLFLRIKLSKKAENKMTKTVENPQDHRDYILTYLFAILLPIYALNLDTFRDSLVVIIALILIIFTFWIMNLHYMNLFFAILGYNFFTINPDQKVGQPVTSFVLITKRTYLNMGQIINVCRISDTVFIELQS